MAEHMLATALEWLEHKSKPFFVAAALIAYAIEVYLLTTAPKPPENLNDFLIQALGALVTPFSIILLQEILELVAKISESNLLSARHQFEIVVLVIVRSFFKSFSKVNGYVQEGVFNETVQEAVVKVFAITILMVLIFLFRMWANSDYLYWYSEQGKRSNLYKQALVVVLVIAALFYQIFAPPQNESYTSHEATAIAQVESHSDSSAETKDDSTATSDGKNKAAVAASTKSDTDKDSAEYSSESGNAEGYAKAKDEHTDFLSRYFDVFAFVSLVFTGLIVIEALFLILSILSGEFPRLMLESGLVIALIFARFPLFVSNTLSYSLSVLGVAFAAAALYLYYRISKWAQDAGHYPTRQQAEQQS